MPRRNRRPISSSESALVSQHSPTAVADRLAARTRSHLADWVLGAIDGAITTFAIVAGVVGAGLSAGVVVVLGVANLLADGLSMAASRYLGAQADLERRKLAERRERHHIAAVPEGEREEVRQIFAGKGFRGDDLDSAVDVITSDDESWVQFMLIEELGFPPEPERALPAARATFLGFLFAGALPLTPFLLDRFLLDLGFDVVPNPTVWSGAITLVAFFTVGALKARLVGLSRLQSGLRTLAVGGSAATVAFTVGWLLRDLA